ncbi:MAG: QueT transporter family protein [Clostridia bacterium]|nr:QueT transporter family protein [Clostridia bacterium]
MKNTKAITKSAIIAAIYVVITLIASLFGLSSGAIQVRFSEALTVLPYFTPAAVPGLFVGCIISNIISGCLLWDIVFGSLATLIGAIGTYFLRKKSIWFAPIPPIVANTVIIPYVLKNVYQLKEAVSYFFVTVFIGELVSCGVLGLLLSMLLKRRKDLVDIIK